MIPFSALLSADFFLQLGCVIVSAAGLVWAARFRRASEGRPSLFLLLTTTFASASYLLQWLLNYIIPYVLINYQSVHTDFELPPWVSIALSILSLALNYAFVAALTLTAWSFWKAYRAEHATVIPMSAGDAGVSIEMPESIEAGKTETGNPSETRPPEESASESIESSTPGSGA